MQKTLFQNMNIIKEKNHICHCYVWAPKENEDLIYENLQEISQKNKYIASGQLQESFSGNARRPPTYFKTNEFTNVFQVKNI
jgi:vacuolar-type H+-ATPase subunit I/STV1